MREIDCSEIADTVEKLCVRAATVLTPDIARALDALS